MTVWLLKDALELVRAIQSDVMKYDYYVALAGGVLNRGYSCNDLDLVCVPMDCPKTEELHAWIKDTFSLTAPTGKRRSKTIYHILYNGKLLDIAILDTCDHVTQYKSNDI